MTHRFGALAALLASMAASAAWADPERDDAFEVDASEEGSEWYGWQTLVVDGAIHGAAAFALFAQASEEIGVLIGVVGGLEYLLGGPVVHWAHGHGGRGAASLGLRLAAPILALVAMGAVYSVMEHHGDAFPMAVAGASVLMAPVVVDAAALSYEQRGARRRATSSVVPTASIDRQRCVVGVAGVL